MASPPSSVAVRTNATTRAQIKCINQDFSNNSNLLTNEKKFVILPYQKLKSPGKKEKDTDETEDLYFTRVAKMAARILIDAGLTEAKEVDKNTLMIGLYSEDYF